jgi:signal peptidase II
MLFWMIVLAALLLDAGSKMLAEHFLQHQTMRLGWVAEFRLTQNTGMAFGMFSDQLLAGIVLPLTAILCGWLMMRRYRITHFTAAACGMVLGGFIGNFAERLISGAVTDMIYFPFLPWFICNVADIAICAGVVLLMVSLLFRPQDWREKVAKDTENCGE